jgi:iron complex transport system substrate-binding protein
MLTVGSVALLAACGTTSQATTPTNAPAASEATSAATNAPIAQTTTVPAPAATAGVAAVVGTNQVRGFPAFASAPTMVELVEERGETLVVRHRFGETEIPKNPQRVYVDAATLGPALLLDLKLVGAEYYAEMTYLPEFEAQMAGVAANEPETNYTFNFERVAALKPDLILAYANVVWTRGGATPESVYDKLQQIAPTVVFFDSPTEYWQQATRDLARVLGMDASATTTFDNFNVEAAEACKPLQEAIGDGAAVRMSIYNGETWVTGVGNQDDDRFVAYSDSYWLYGLCGINPPANFRELIGLEGAVQLSAEKIPELQADYLFISVGGDTGEATYQKLIDNPLWQTVPAVKNGNVYVIRYISAVEYGTSLLAIQEAAAAVKNTR